MVEPVALSLLSLEGVWITLRNAPLKPVDDGDGEDADTFRLYDPLR